MAKVYNVEISPSDHSPLLLCPETQVRGNKKRQFHFENAWLTEPMCSQIMKDCWDDNESDTVLQKLNKCAKSLQVWGREITGCFSNRIKKCKDKMKKLKGKQDAQSLAEFDNAKK